MAMHTTAFVSNRTPLALLYLLLYCQTCLATADEIAKRQDTPSSTGLGYLETPSPVPVGLTLVGRQFTTETVPPGFSTIFDSSPGFTETTSTTRTTFPPDTPTPTPPTPPPITPIIDTTSTTTTRTSTSAESRSTSTTSRGRTSTITVDLGSTTTFADSWWTTGSATATAGGAEVADPTSSFVPESFELYDRMQDLRRFGMAAIVLLVINALLLSTALGFAGFIYLKHFRGHKHPSYTSSTFSSSSASLIPNKRQSMVSKGRLATPSLSGTVPRALAGRQIPSHHYPRRSWDQVTTIASTSTESERRRRQRVSRVEEEEEDVSLADTDRRDDPSRRSIQSSMAETDTSMIRSSSGVSVILDSSGRGTNGVR